MKKENAEDEEKLTPGQTVYTQICETYPFLNEQEKQDFESKAANISTTDPVEGTRQLLEALENPHTAFKKISKTQNTKTELSPERQPSYEIIDDVLVVRIPSWNRNIDIENLIRHVDENTKQTAGLVIDVRENGGGSDNPAFRFARRFIPKGEYSFGTFLKKGQNGDMENIPATIESNNNNPLDTPIVILTSKETFSSCELFVAAMKAGTHCTVIGEPTGGGSAFREEFFVEIDEQQYSVKIPTRRLILTGERDPIEKTCIKPDFPYEGSDIIEFAVKFVKSKAKR